jgi:O-methyltransferase domain/Dimerisation domain
MIESSGTIGSVAGTSPLVEMAMGYARSRALCAAARLGIADALADGERTVDQLSTACRADPASLHRLLRALASFGIVSESAPGRFVLTEFGAPLRKTAPNSAWAAIVFWAELLADSWSYLTDCVRTGETAAQIMKRSGATSRWSSDPEAPAIFRSVMGTGPAQDYMPLAHAWDFSGRRVVADLGGGGGALIFAVLRAYPEVQGMLVDRQEAVDAAKSRLVSEGLLSRCTLVAADLCRSVPSGADVYILKHVLHGYSDDAATDILRKCRDAISADGRLLVIEFVLPAVVNSVDQELERRLMSDLNMLAVTGGRERNAVEWKKLLRRANFRITRIIDVPGDSACIIEAAPLDGR